MENRYWIGVAQKSHSDRGVEGGFAQLNHDKKAPLLKMKAGDWLIYYSPRLSMESSEPLQSFTAIGRVKNGEVYEVDMGNDFVPYRLDIAYLPCKEMPIRPLLDKLSFTREQKNWGQSFRFGHFEITKSDFLLIAQEMGIDLSPSTP